MLWSKAGNLEGGICDFLLDTLQYKKIQYLGLIFLKGEIGNFFPNTPRNKRYFKAVVSKTRCFKTKICKVVIVFPGNWDA